MKLIPIYQNLNNVNNKNPLMPHINRVKIDRVKLSFRLMNE